MIIDEKGRLFGKVSVVDIFIILVVIGGAVFAVRTFGNKTITESTSRDIVLTFFAEDVYDFVAENISEGDMFQDEINDVNVGRIKKVTLSDGYKYVQNKDNEIVKAYMEGRKYVEVAVDAKGQVNQNGVLIGGRHYEVGSYVTMRLGSSKISGVIASVE